MLGAERRVAGTEFRMLGVERRIAGTECRMLGLRSHPPHVHFGNARVEFGFARHMLMPQRRRQFIGSRNFCAELRFPQIHALFQGAFPERDVSIDDVRLHPQGVQKPFLLIGNVIIIQAIKVLVGVLMFLHECRDLQVPAVLFVGPGSGGLANDDLGAEAGKVTACKHLVFQALDVEFQEIDLALDVGFTKAAQRPGFDLPVSLAEIIGGAGLPRGGSFMQDQGAVLARQGDVQVDVAGAVLLQRGESLGMGLHIDAAPPLVVKGLRHRRGFGPTGADVDVEAARLPPEDPVQDNVFAILRIGNEHQTESFSTAKCSTETSSMVVPIE